MVMRIARDCRLLIADDDSAFRATVEEILRPHFQTVQAVSGEQALEISERVRIDMALVDMHMHVLTGLETIRHLRDRFRELPCVLMSSDVSEELTSQALDLETYSVIRKPPRQAELINTIRGALRL